MFFITCFSRCEKDEHGFFRGGAQRTFGFKERFEDAEHALNNNVCDMHEYLYVYAVVEEMYPAIHPEVEREVWFAWDEGRGGFYQIEKPEATHGTCNFAIG